MYKPKKGSQTGCSVHSLVPVLVFGAVDRVEGLVGFGLGSLLRRRELELDEERRAAHLCAKHELVDLVHNGLDLVLRVT